MRVLHLADLHLLLRGPRSGECRRILDWIAEHAADVRPDAIIIAGDVFDRLSSPDDREYLADWLGHLSGSAAMVFATRGNHDDLTDERFFRRLYPTVEIITEPVVRSFANLSLAFLPWPDMGRLAAALGPKASIADRIDGAHTALINILRGFRADLEIRPGVPSLLVAHLPVLGASMDSGQPVATGNEIGLSADELLECGSAGAAMGHVHLRQQMKSSDGRPVWYAGAPFRGSFGEATGTKGGLVWTWDDGHGVEPGCWRVEPWNTPALRMPLLECSWNSGHLEGGSWIASDVRNAEVRIRVSFPADEREAARAAADAAKREMEEAGAFSVTIDPQPIVIQRTRCAEIAGAKTTMEKVGAWARSADIEVPGGAAEKMAALEMEVGV